MGVVSCNNVVMTTLRCHERQHVDTDVIPSHDGP